MAIIADSSSNAAHKLVCIASESTRQSDIAKAIAVNGGSAAVQQAFVAADKAHYLRVAASALSNGVQVATFLEAARFVGTHA